MAATDVVVSKRLVIGFGALLGVMVAVTALAVTSLPKSAPLHRQARGIGQVSGAVAGLDQTTQQNAAMMEQRAAAAERHESQAAQLAETVRLFLIVRAPAEPLEQRRALDAHAHSASPAQRQDPWLARPTGGLSTSGACRATERPHM